MARKRTINLAVLNIKTQPHTTEKYLELFETTFKLRQPGKIRGDDWGMIGTLYNSRDESGPGILFGEIYKFLNIDPRGEWLDLNQGIPINADEEDAIPPVPEHMKPNLRKIEFIFYPDLHRLCFETKFISPGSLRKLMNILLSHPFIMDRFGEVDISLETTREAIQMILQIPRLTQLDIDVTLPNDDVLSDLSEKIYDRLKNQNVRRIDQTVTSTDDEGIKPDEETKAFMDIARSNGRVRAKGYEGKEIIERSTEDHPLRKKYYYNPEIQTKLQAMLMASSALLKNIKS